MTVDKKLLEMYEVAVPKYLRHAIDEYKKEENNPNCSHIDCLLDEIYGSINSAYWDNEIGKEQADYLRDKYYYGKDWAKGEKSDY